MRDFSLRTIHLLHLNQPGVGHLVGYLVDGQISVLYVGVDPAVTTLCKRGWVLMRSLVPIQ